MKEVLIISHSKSISYFKIGSHHYANELFKLGYNVSYLSTPVTLYHYLFGSIPHGARQIHEEINEIKLKFIIPSTFSNNFFLSKTNTVCDKIFGVKCKKKFDIIICDTPFLVDYLTKFKYEHLVYRPTDDYYELIGEKANIQEKKIINMSDVVIATSCEVKNSLERRLGLKNCGVIENGFEDDFFKELIPFESRGKKAIYIGAIDDRFDFEMLGYLVSNRPDVTFSIYGPLNNEIHKNKLFEIVENYANLDYLGPINYRDTSKVLNENRVGILLFSKHKSNKGRSPMKLYEFNAAGVNVIFPDYCLINDYENKKIFKYNKDNILAQFDFALNKNESIDGVLLKKSWKFKVKELLNFIKGINNGS